jgi:hypothetical protein
VYARVVPQATSIHIYYQIFYGVFVATGLVVAATWIQQKSQKNVLILVVGIVVVGSTMFGVQSWNQDKEVGFGSPKDLELFMHYLRPLPTMPTSTIAVAADPSLNGWLDNPNIVFYAGRRLIASTEEEVLHAEYVITQNNHIQEKISFFQQATKGAFVYHQVACSPNFCILKRNPNANYDKKK